LVQSYETPKNLFFKEIKERWKNGGENAFHPELPCGCGGKACCIFTIFLAMSRGQGRILKGCSPPMTVDNLPVFSAEMY
jgi:hypothetical protein